MSIFFEKNQRFGTLDVVFVVALLTIVAMISQSVLSEVFADHTRIEARMKVESLAFRLALDSEDLSRAPASVSSEPIGLTIGKISLDPWGHPYSYEIKRKPSGKVDQVTVWSEGSAESRVQYVFKAP